jgi:predicted secreted protein
MIISKPRRIMVGLTALALAAGGLATPASAGASSTHMPKYTLSDSGRSVTVEKSHKIKIDLRTNQDGGYAWKIGKQTGTHPMSVVRRTVRPYKHKPGTVGFPFHTIYILKAVNVGKGTVKFVERQPFDKSNVAKRFRLHIHVPGAAKHRTHHACTTTSSGSCIQGGEFCPQADYGQSGWDASGRRYVCTGDTVHPHWETP